MPFHGSNRGSNPLGDATPVIEVRGAGFTNKGAQLMLLAARDRLFARYPAAKLTMTTSHSAGTSPFAQVVRAGFFPKAELWRWGIPWGDFVGLMPRKAREMGGVVLDRDVDAVLDISGFAYSDQWGGRALHQAARSAHRWRKQGTKLILLPQAFGPIKDQANQAAFRRLLASADLVFARDALSEDWVRRFTPHPDGVRRAPDFTNLIDGIPPQSPSDFEDVVAITPNYRMLDKTDAKTRERYIPFLVSAVERVARARLRPLLLIHEGEPDRLLAEQVLNRAGRGEILVEPDPLKLKGILGCCAAAIGSRYHGLVSCLSQGVPALGTSWSHKYKALFEDYDFSSGLIDLCDHLSAEHQLDLLLDPQWRLAMRGKLQSRALALRYEAERMWDEIYGLLEGADK